LDDDGPRMNIEDHNREDTVYLVDDVDDDEDAAKVVRRYYSVIFEQELAPYKRCTQPNKAEWTE